MRVESETARVLITVKATPQPSETRGDTVCVAGIRLDGPAPTWIRLYPIAFRYLDGDAQFNKYDIITAQVRRRDKDTRSESYSPDEGSWTKVDHLSSWQTRHEIVSKLAPTSTCDLVAAAKADTSAPSLGLVYPREVLGLKFDPHPKWTQDQIRKMEQRISREQTALIPSAAVPQLLKEPRFEVRYRYLCDSMKCESHVGRILDWELTALQNRYHRDSDDRVKEVVTDRFHKMMFNPKRRAGFFMGNFELGTRRAKFSVLGTYYPEITDIERATSTLF